MKIKMIDPPSGWKYGFPKEVGDSTPEEILRNSGYPEEDIEFALRYCRYWEQEVNAD